jgi:hypothetical protein
MTGYGGAGAFACQPASGRLGPARRPVPPPVRGAIADPREIQP